MRAVSILGICLLLALYAAGSACAQARKIPCAAVQPVPDIPFDGHKLREIADISDPSLRRINELLTAGCFDEAASELDAYALAHPADHRITYLQARGAWMTGSPDQAEALLKDTISKYPDFASASILLAGLYLSREQYEPVSALLDSAQRIAPSDLWLFVDRLRLAAPTSPDSESIDTIVRVMQDKRFSRNVRLQMVALILNHLQQRVDAPTLDAAYRASIDFGINSREDSVGRYALWLIEDQQRTAEARQWLEPLLQTPLRNPEFVHRMLAESYLFDAARIDPVQTSRNFALIEKARSEMGGNIDSIARDAALNRRLAPLQGFFAIVEDLDKPDDEGLTALCAALQALVLDVPMIKSMLGNLANPNQECAGGLNFTPVGLILIQARPQQTADRIDILKDLLARGADPNPHVFGTDAITFCKNDARRCEALLGVLQPAWDAAAARGK